MNVNLAPPKRPPEKLCEECGHEESAHVGHLIMESGGVDLSEFVDVPCHVDDCGCPLFVEAVEP